MAKEETEITKEKSAHRITNPVRQRLYPLKDAAAYLGRSVDSLRELIYAGTFPIIQEGERSKIWLDVHDLDKWIQQKKHTLLEERH